MCFEFKKLILYIFDEYFIRVINLRHSPPFLRFHPIEVGRVLQNTRDPVAFRLESPWSVSHEKSYHLLLVQRCLAVVLYHNLVHLSLEVFDVDSLALGSEGVLVIDLLGGQFVVDEGGVWEMKEIVNASPLMSFWTYTFGACTFFMAQ